jgi:hypothetical protein
MDTALIAAGIAAIAAVFAAAMSWIAAHQSRRSSDRAHAWTRIRWAARLRDGDTEYDISRTVLEKLAAVRWASRDDRDLAEDVLDHRARTARPPDRNEEP